MDDFNLDLDFRCSTKWELMHLKVGGEGRLVGGGMEMEIYKEIREF